MNSNTMIYFASFGVKHIQKEIENFTGNKNVITNIYEIQAFVSKRSKYFCTGFILFTFKGESLTGFTNLFSPNDFKKNDKLILNYFLKRNY